MTNEPNKFKIICPFCDAPYTANMLLTLERAFEATSPSGYGAGADVIIDIFCENCKRLIYRKEVEI
jgi:hypothetical protein